MHVFGTRVPRRLGVTRSASSPKAAQALGCSPSPVSGSRLAGSPAWHGLPQCPGCGHWVSYCCAAFVFGSGMRLGVGFVNCNRLAWATRTGLQALARLRLWRVAMVIARVAEIAICSESVDFDDCLVGFFIIKYRLQCLIVAAVISHS